MNVSLKGYFRGQQLERTWLVTRGPRVNYINIDPEALLEDPPVAHRIHSRIDGKEERKRIKDAIEFSREIEASLAATPEDIEARIREQAERFLKLQRTGALVGSWEHRENPSKRSSFSLLFVPIFLTHT